MKKLTSLIFLSALCALPSFAALKMPAIFSDNMLLQQGVPVKLWGGAKAGAEIEARFKGATAKTTADGDGKWSLFLPSLSADKAPAELLLFENGREALKIKNVLVGEVWMTGGQSNMEMTVTGTSDWPRVQQEGERGRYSMMRYFTQPRTVTAEAPQEDFHPGSKWLECDSESMKSARFNATAFYFAEALMKDLDVPVGIISSAHGGSPMRSWTDFETVSKSENFREIWDDFLKRKSEYSYEEALAKLEKTRRDFEAKAAKAKAEGKKRPTTPHQLTELHRPWPDSPDSFRTPSQLYNGKVAPAAGYSIRGFLWYQGEADGSAPSRDTFGKQFESLIRSWRRAWGNESLPFIFAQLPSYGTSSWPDIRLQQTDVFKADKNVGMAVLIDCGEEKDIHPKDKTTVGRRMELIAKKMAYGKQDVNAYGPFFKKAQFKGKSALLSFDMDGCAFRPVETPKGFEVRGAYGNWKPAKATVGNDSISVAAEDGGAFSAVRYLYLAWARPLAQVFNQNGLPLAPFVAEK